MLGQCANFVFFKKILASCVYWMTSDFKLQMIGFCCIGSLHCNATLRSSAMQCCVATQRCVASMRNVLLRCVTTQHFVALRCIATQHSVALRRNATQRCVASQRNIALRCVATQRFVALRHRDAKTHLKRAQLSDEAKQDRDLPVSHSVSSLLLLFFLLMLLLLLYYVVVYSRLNLFRCLKCVIASLFGALSVRP